MGKGFQSGGKIAVLAVMLALLGGCGTVISAAGTAVSTTVDRTTDAVVTGADLVATPFRGGEEEEMVEPTE